MGIGGHTNVEMRNADGDLILPVGVQRVVFAAEGLWRARQAVSTPINSEQLIAALSSIGGAVLPKCSISTPAADINFSFDAANNLRLKCDHSPGSHCWDLAGIRKTC